MHVRTRTTKGVLLESLRHSFFTKLHLTYSSIFACQGSPICCTHWWLLPSIDGKYLHSILQYLSLLDFYYQWRLLSIDTTNVNNYILLSPYRPTLVIIPASLGRRITDEI